MLPILSSTLTPHTWNKVEYFKLTSQHIVVISIIHCEVVDLPNLREEQGIPEPYSVINNPYELQLQVSFTGKKTCTPDYLL